MIEESAFTKATTIYDNNRFKVWTVQVPDLKCSFNGKVQVFNWFPAIVFICTSKIKNMIFCKKFWSMCRKKGRRMPCIKIASNRHGHFTNKKRCFNMSFKLCSTSKLHRIALLCYRKGSSDASSFFLNFNFLDSFAEKQEAVHQHFIDSRDHLQKRGGGGSTFP